MRSPLLATGSWGKLLREDTCEAWVHLGLQGDLFLPAADTMGGSRGMLFLPTAL